MNAALDLHPPSIVDRWVFGRDPNQRRAILRVILGGWTYLAAVVVELGASVLRVDQVDKLVWIAGYTLCGPLLFYALLRSGVARRMNDPRLILPQLLFAASAAAAGAAFVAELRGPMLELLCVALMFDVHRLRPRQFFLAAATSIGLLIAVMLGSWLLSDRPVRASEELPGILTGVLVFAAIYMVALRVMAMRRRQVEQTASLEAALAQQRALAERDGLTGLYNRRYAQEHLGQTCRRERASNTAMAVALFDIDHFKQINDRFGHATGDLVLQRLSAVVQAELRPGGVFARWGGEEFLLLVELPPDEALQVVDRLRRQIAAQDWQHIASGLGVTVSAGVASCRDGEPWDATLLRADTALYAAKVGGRDRVCCAAR